MQVEERKSERGLMKTRQGVVVSDKMTKTVVVAVTSQVRHAQYGKFIKRTHKFFAHDQKEECGVGDRVIISEARPLSRMKRWRVHKIIEKAST